MGRETLHELLHIAAGVAVVVLLFKGAAWAYPLGKATIYAVGWVTGIAVVAMGAGGLRRAYGLDHAGPASDG